MAPGVWCAPHRISPSWRSLSKARRLRQTCARCSRRSTRCCVRIRKSASTIRRFDRSPRPATRGAGPREAGAGEGEGKKGEAERSRPVSRFHRMPEEKRDLHNQLDRLQEKLPKPVARPLGKLRHPNWKWARIPASILMIIGGLLSFLPVRGVWRLPLGIALLAIDVPFLRKPTARLVEWCLDKWEAWRERRGAHQ